MGKCSLLLYGLIVKSRETQESGFAKEWGNRVCPVGLGYLLWLKKKLLKTLILTDRHQIKTLLLEYSWKE